MDSPDDEGWYWFKPKLSKEEYVVYVNWEGEVFSLNESGEAFRIEETVGEWRYL
jgi:hypothetical protein